MSSDVESTKSDSTSSSWDEAKLCSRGVEGDGFGESDEKTHTQKYAYTTMLVFA